MSEDRLILAIGRLEQALSRIEASAQNPLPKSVTHNDDDLDARHAQLCRKVEGAIAVLDNMIAKG